MAHIIIPTTVVITTIIAILHSCHFYFDNYFAPPFRDSSSDFSLAGSRTVACHLVPVTFVQQSQAER